MLRSGSRPFGRSWRSSRIEDAVQTSDPLEDMAGYVPSLDIDTDFSVRGLERSVSLVRLLRGSYAKVAALIMKETN